MKQAEKKLGDFRKKLERVQNGSEITGEHLTLATLVAGAVLLVLLTVRVPDQPKDEEVELTKYQEDYVDCPERYLETCTAMSRIGTSNVSFWKVEGSRMFLKLEDGRAIVSTLPSNGSRGEFVTHMSAEEVTSQT